MIYDFFNDLFNKIERINWIYRINQIDWTKWTGNKQTMNVALASILQSK